ncbi:flagellar hook-length control protein FliK [Stappia sp.]|uniref:flagellar hook-length control protein FliK n=1 Tax=Stappia sp. TaxID=1870903 RepID=UPI003D0C47EB
MILANPVSSFPASVAGLAGQAGSQAAGQAGSQAAGQATGAGLMAGTPSMFALDLGAATAGMRTTAGASASSQGFAGRGGIPLAGLRELHVDASMLVQLDIEAGPPAAVSPRGWFADAVRAGEGVMAGALTGEGVAGRLTTELAEDGSAADTTLDVAAQTDIPAGIAGLLSGMIAAAGQASATLSDTPAGTGFSTALSAQAAVGATEGVSGAVEGGTSTAGSAATGSAVSGSGAAATGSALTQPAVAGTGATPGAIASNDDSSPGLPSTSASLSVKVAGGLAGGLALAAEAGGNSQAVAGAMTRGATSPASDDAAAQAARAMTAQAGEIQAGAALATDDATGAATTGAATTGAGTTGAGAAVAGSAAALPGGNIIEATLSTGAGTTTTTERSAGPAGVESRIEGQGGSAAIRVSTAPATAGTSAAGGLTQTAAASLVATATGVPATEPDGAAFSGTGEAGTGATTSARAASQPQAGNTEGLLPGRQGAENPNANSQGIGVRAGGDQAPAMTADVEAGAVPGETPGTAAKRLDAAADPARAGAIPTADVAASAAAGTNVRPAPDALVAGKLSVSGMAPASALAGAVIPAGDMDISITTSTVADDAAAAGGTGTASREQGTPVAGGQAMPALTGQVANVLPRGAASAAARTSELDYAQAVEDATAGTSGQDGEGAGAAREGNGKPAGASAPQAAASQPIEIQRPGVSAAALAFAAAMTEGDASQGEGSDPFNGLTEIARADAQASVSTAALRGSTAALPQNAAVASAHLAAEVARFAQKGQTRFQIRMDPPELGRVDVELKVSRDGTVRAHLAVERSETLDMFLRDQRGLERALDAAGLKLENAGLEMSLMNQNGSTAFDRGEGGEGRSSQPGEGGVLQKEDGDTLPMAAARAYVSGASGALDIQI